METETLDEAVPETQSAKILGVSVHTLRAWRFRKTGPPYFKIQGRSVRYGLRELLAFRESFRVVPETPALRQHRDDASRRGYSE
jgi:hypothetical protein